MNIGIFILPYLPIIGGAQLQAHGLADTLSKLGQNVTVFAAKRCVVQSRKMGWKFTYKLKGLSCPKSPILAISKRIWLTLTADQIRRVLVADKLDIVQLIMAWPWLTVAGDIREMGVPVLIRASGDDVQIDKNLGYGIRINKNKDQIIRSGFKSISKAVAISGSIAEEYVNLGVPRNDIVEIAPGVNYDAFDNCEVDIREIKTRYGIPLHKKVVLSVGRNHPKKGFTDLVKALYHLNNSKDEYVVVIVGEGVGELIEVAESIRQGHNFIPLKELRGIGNGVVTSFPCPELIEVYKSADYFVLPSYLEGYPNVTLEASAAGIPVVVTDSSGCRDAVTDGKDGLIVPPHSPAKIADTIFRLENQQDLRKRVVNSGRKKAQSQTWKSVAKRYLDLYETVV